MSIKPHQLLLALVLALAVAGCSTDETTAVETGAAESALTCTPGAEMCDWGCYYVGGPSSSDCIIKCNAAGTGWIKVQDCGWAQNWPYSSSCLDANPHPICQWN